MTSTPRVDIGEIIRDGSAIDRAIVAARRRVIETHRRLGVPLVVWCVARKEHAYRRG